MASYQDLGEKRTGKSSAKERTGRHGKPVDGLDYPVTPHESKPTVAKTIPSKLDQMPSYGEDPFVLNPSLKGYKQADTWRGSYYFPVNAQRMVKNVTEAESRDKDFPYKEIKGKNSGPASVRTSRG